MISQELKVIIANLRQQGKMSFMPKANDQDIEAFETKNAIQLPSQYKEWLQFSDGGECFLPGGIQLYGVAHKPLIDVDDQDRPDDNYVVMGALATGDPVLFKKNSEQVCIYNHEADCIESDEIYPDFFAFMDDLYDLLGIGE